MTIQWTREDDEKAIEQGWDVVYSESSGVLEIERIDEMEVFPDDDCALMFVVNKAVEGNELAQKALLVTWNQI